MAKHTEPTNTYEAMLKRDLSEFKEPTNLPSGEWVIRCSSAGTKPNDEHDPDDVNSPLFMINFGLVPVEPYDNVESDLVESGEWRGKRHFHTIFVKGDGDVVEARKIIAGFGVNPEGRDLTDGLDLLKNRSALVTVGLRTFKSKRTGNTEQVNTFSNFRPVA